MPHQDFFVDCRPEDNRTKLSHLEMYRGDTLTFKVIVNDNGDPIDITGGSFWWTVKDDLNDPDSEAIFQKDMTNGISILYPELGQLIVTLDPAETIALQLEETKTYYWDLQYQDSLGTVQTIFFGRLTIHLDVTEEPGFIVGLGDMIVTGALQGVPILAGVNDVADGDGISINEQQSVHVDGAIAGTFTITVEDPNNVGVFETTAPLNWNATALDIETAIEALTFIDGVTATGGPLDTGAVVVEFDGPLVALVDVPLMTMDVSGLA